MNDTHLKPIHNYYENLLNIIKSNKINLNGIIDPHILLDVPLFEDDALFSIRNECSQQNKSCIYNSFLMKKYEFCLILGGDPIKIINQIQKVCIS